MNDADRIRENRARRAVAKLGLRLAKSRARDTRRPEFGNFHIVNPVNNAIVAGGSPRDYSMSLEDVEAFVTEPEAEESR